MSYFGFSPTQQNKQLAYAVEHPIGTGTLQDAAFFDGAGTAIFEGFWSGVRQADQVGWAALDTAISPVADAVSETFGVRDSSADFFKEQRKLAETRVRELTPDPGTTGTAGQVLFSLGQLGGQAIAGSLMGGPWSAAATVGTLQGFSDYEKSRADGVDYGTAVDKALVTGGTAALGAVLPMSLGLRAGGAVAEGVGAALSVGRGASGALAGAVARAAPDLFYSAGTNVAMGMAQRGLSAKILRRGGYEDMARQYDVMDAQALATDAVLGLAFGGLGRFINSRGEDVPVRRVSPEEIDAALTSSSHVNFEVTAAPGVPVSVLSRNAHAQAMNKAMTDVLAGEPVDVGALLEGAEFLQKMPRVNLASQSVRKALGLKGEATTAAEQYHADIAGMSGLSTPKPRTVAQVRQDQLAAGEHQARGNDTAGDEYDFRHAERAVMENPDLEVHVVSHDDSVTAVRAADLLAQANKDVENAKHDAGLFDVAVSCFLGRA